MYTHHIIPPVISSSPDVVSDMPVFVGTLAPARVTQIIMFENGTTENQSLYTR